MRRLATLTLSIGFALLVLLARPLLASTVRYVTDAELIARSERVVHARILAQRVTRGGPEGLTIYTVTTMDVLEDFTGQSGDTIEVWELGGVIGSEMLYVGGAVTYTVGGEVLVCLERGPNGWRSIAMGFSKFDVVRAAGGGLVLKRNIRDTVVVGGPPQVSERSLDEFRRLAATVRGRASRRVAESSAAAEVHAEEDYTLFSGGWRWTQADSAMPIPWYKNTTAAPPIAGNADSEIQTALAAWTTPTSASIILQYAGTTSQSAAKGPWAGIPDGNGVITFEDPNNEISGLTLAIGGGSAEVGTGGTLGGITFNRFLRGYVIFQNAADLDAQFKTSLGFTRVLQHEIGHAIGFGHTDDDPMVVRPEANIMNSSCCVTDTPIPPAIGPDDLAGLNFIYPSNPTGPSMALDKTTLRFGAVTNGAALLTQTSAQTVRLTQTGAGTVTWTATSNQPWLQVSPASGSGSAGLSISVASVGGLPAGGMVGGAITLIFTGASNTPGPINVTLTLFLNGTSANPIGNVDTPIDNQTGVEGSVPFTGWAVDDLEVTRVSVCRAAVAPEVAPVDPNCGGAAQMFVGFAVFIDGARPDVAALYSTYPANTKAGWGFMVLTNMLPNQGNGTYQFSMWAQDREGHAVVIGTRTLTCTNATGRKPFGAIDTPSQGGLASGGAYAVFGWVLSRVARADPPGGGTVTVLVNGAAVGSPGGWTARPDLTALFAGYPGIATALGVYGLNTTTLTNGTHTISWTVVDNVGVVEGIGSRFFTVSNGAGSLTARALAQTAERGTSVPRPESGTILGRRGWDLEAPLRAFDPDASGRIVVHSEEVSRVELHAAATRGYMRTSEGRAPLPIGSQIDASTGVFTWAPGVGFVGPYDFEFVSHDGSTRDVRIVLQPKGSHLSGPQVVIDTPRSQQDVGQPFVLAGWAADLNAPQGTGVATVHAWAYPLTGGPPVFLGATAYGGARPDVAAVHGEEFEASGFGLHVQGLTPGHYDLAVFAWSTERSDFVPAKVVRITVR